MLKPWIKLLPYAFVVWLARKHCERINLPPNVLSGGYVAVNPFRYEIVAWKEPQP